MTTIESLVPDEVLKVFEDAGMRVNDFERNGHILVFELEGCTDCGGDMVHSLYLNDNEVSSAWAWRRAFTEMNDSFDPWEEAHKWLGADGSPIPGQTPFHDGFALYTDVVRYSKALDDVEERLWEIEE